MACLSSFQGLGTSFCEGVDGDCSCLACFCIPESGILDVHSSLQAPFYQGCPETQSVNTLTMAGVWVDLSGNSREGRKANFIPRGSQDCSVLRGP